MSSLKIHEAIKISSKFSLKPKGLLYVQTRSIFLLVDQVVVCRWTWNINLLCKSTDKFFLFQRQARQKASDLQETHIDLELLHLQKPGEPFDVNIFYKVSLTHSALLFL